MTSDRTDADRELAQLDEQLAELRDRLGMTDSEEIKETARLVAFLKD